MDLESSSPGPSAPDEQGERRNPASARFGPWLAVGVCLLLGLVSLGWPAGRDQGIEGATAMLLTWGWVPYRDVWSHSPPGGFCLLAVGFSVLGPGPVAIRIVDLLWMAIGVGALAHLVGRHHGPWAAALAGLLLALSYYGHGDFWQTAQRDGFMITPTLLALACADASRDAQGRGSSRRARVLTIVSGALVGLATSFKPGGLFVALPVIVALGWRPRAWGLAALGGAGVALVGALALMALGAWEPMLDAVLGFNRGYAANYAQHAPERWLAVPRGVAGFFGERPELGLALLGLAAAGRLRWIGLALLAAALASPATQAGLYPYHFLPLLAPAALLGGLAPVAVFDALERRGPGAPRPRWVAPALVTVVAASCIPAAIGWSSHLAATLRRLNGDMSDDQYNERYAAAREYELLAAHIKSHSPPDARVLPWNSDPQLLLLAERAPADRYLVAFPLFAPWGALDDRAALVDRLSEDPPQFVLVRSGDHLTWLSGSPLDSAGALAQYPEMLAWLRPNYTVVRSTPRLLLLERNATAGSGGAR